METGQRFGEQCGSVRRDSRPSRDGEKDQGREMWWSWRLPVLESGDSRWFNTNFLCQIVLMISQSSIQTFRWCGSCKVDQASSGQTQQEMSSVGEEPPLVLSTQQRQPWRQVAGETMFQHQKLPPGYAPGSRVVRWSDLLTASKPKSFMSSSSER